MEDYRNSFVKTSKKFFEEVRKDREAFSKTLKDFEYECTINVDTCEGITSTCIIIFNFEKHERFAVIEALNKSGDSMAFAMANNFLRKVSDTVIDDGMNQIFSLMKDVLRVHSINTGSR